MCMDPGRGSWGDEGVEWGGVARGRGPVASPLEAGPRHPSGLQRASTGVSEAPGRERQRGRESKASCTLASPRHGHPRGRGVWRRARGPRPGGPRPSTRQRSRLTPHHPPSGAHPHKHNHHATTHSTPPHHLTPSIHQPNSPPITLLTTHHRCLKQDHNLRYWTVALAAHAASAPSRFCKTGHIFSETGYIFTFAILSSSIFTSSVS